MINYINLIKYLLMKYINHGKKNLKAKDKFAKNKTKLLLMK